MNSRKFLFPDFFKFIYLFVSSSQLAARIISARVFPTFQFVRFRYGCDSIPVVI